MKMAGSRLRPLMCVGFAYFLIAVLIPMIILSDGTQPGQWTTSGTIWSLAGGAAGALGAIGIIMAFNFGGKPIYVMPLVFGSAPVINTFVSILSSKTAHFADASPLFYAGLIIVAVGAVVVLVFAPKAGPHAAKPSPAPCAAGNRQRLDAVVGLSGCCRRQPLAAAHVPRTEPNHSMCWRGQ